LNIVPDIDDEKKKILDRKKQVLHA